ncbi:MAG: hypothetical protein B7Y36_11485 [Novosphingobium sp. 28-62-57]|nr:MAG: hypothetical protein B7Z34_03350 [Novosphingobium sp. 12-62-10]OYZ09996.1 MAG: hypothetical protein B7Y36_11485 [Novosphingobium sp. 28-62-57]
MERQNTGSLLPVRFDPTAPASVVAEGDSTWDALVVVPILMWPILLIVFVFGWLPFVVGYEPRRAVKVNDELF